MSTIIRTDRNERAGLDGGVRESDGFNEKKKLKIKNSSSTQSRLVNMEKKHARFA